MKTTIQNIFMLSLVAGFVSCGDDVLIEPAESVLSDSATYIREITVNMPEIQPNEDFADTRVAYDFSTGKHPWTVGDTLGIFPSVGGQVEFAIDENTAGGTSASFDGGGWALKKSSKYAAYFPYSKRNVYTTNKAIPMDYTGQVQTGNESTAHLASFDYLASGSITSSSDGKLNFPLTRFGSFLRLRFNVPASDTYTSLELFSSNTPFVTKAELDVSGTSPKVTEKETSYVIRLKLKDVTLTKDSRLTAWMMAYPVALASGGGTLRAVLHGTKGDYEADLTPQNLTANNPFAFTATLSNAKLRNLSLIANAEQNNSISFSKDENGYVDVKVNSELLKQVKTIKVSTTNDPTICDEIGFFPNLEILQCTGNSNYNNNLVALDVSKNPELVELICSANNLTTLDLSNNMKLKVLNIGGNSISNIDLSNNPVLEELDCSGQKVDFTTLDLTNNINLKIVRCFNNKIESLDLSYNKILEVLDCRGNPSLTSLDLSNHKALKTLICYGASSSVGELASLDITNCTALTDIQCQYNNLANLDLSTNTALLTLDCSHNKLLTLDVSKNKALKSLSCGYNSISQLSILTNELTQLTTLNVQSCTSLTSLECYSPITDYKNGAGALTSLNITGCTNLVTLNCSGNKITRLLLSEYKKLRNLNCSGNKLNSLDVSSNTNLTKLSCYANHISTLDITKCTSLKLYGGNSTNRSWVYCGSQWSNANKTTERTLTLSITSSNSGSLQETGTLNKNVTVNTVTQ